MEVLFSKKIICKNCGRKFKGKKERKKRVYICSGYDNYGACTRIPIKEELLVELLKRRYSEQFNTSKENIQNVVKSIEVRGSMLFTINLVNDIPIIFGDNYIQY